MRVIQCCFPVAALIMAAGCGPQQLYEGDDRPSAKVSVVSDFSRENSRAGPNLVVYAVDDVEVHYIDRIDSAVLPGHHVFKFGPGSGYVLLPSPPESTRYLFIVSADTKAGFSYVPSLKQGGTGKRLSITDAVGCILEETPGETPVEIGCDNNLKPFPSANEIKDDRLAVKAEASDMQQDHP